MTASAAAQGWMRLQAGCIQDPSDGEQSPACAGSPRRRGSPSLQPPEDRVRILDSASAAQADRATDCETGRWWLVHGVTPVGVPRSGSGWAWLPRESQHDDKRANEGRRGSLSPVYICLRL